MIEQLRKLAKQWRVRMAGVHELPGPMSTLNAGLIHRCVQELEAVLPREKEAGIVTIAAVFFSLNGHAAQLAYEHTIARADSVTGARTTYNLLFPPPGKWDRYGEAPYWSTGFDGVGPDLEERGHIDVVGFLKAAGQLSALVMNRPAAGTPQVEPWDGCKARAEHWAWAAGVWKGAAMALGCQKIKTVKDVASVEDLLAVGRRMVVP